MCASQSQLGCSSFGRFGVVVDDDSLANILYTNRKWFQSKIVNAKCDSKRAFILLLPNSTHSHTLQTRHTHTYISHSKNYEMKPYSIIQFVVLNSFFLCRSCCRRCSIDFNLSKQAQNKSDRIGTNRRKKKLVFFSFSTIFHWSVREVDFRSRLISHKINLFDFDKKWSTKSCRRKWKHTRMGWFSIQLTMINERTQLNKKKTMTPSFQVQWRAIISSYPRNGLKNGYSDRRHLKIWRQCRWTDGSYHISVNCHEPIHTFSYQHRSQYAAAN